MAYRKISLCNVSTINKSHVCHGEDGSDKLKRSKKSVCEFKN